MKSCLRTFLILLLLWPLCLRAQINAFFPGGTYDPSIPTPESVTGTAPGDRALRYDEVIRYVKAVAEKSRRVALFDLGKTYEGRALYYMAFSSPENIARLDEIRRNNARIANPAGGSGGAVDNLVSSSPVIVWAQYAIHGGEISSVDAAVALTYQLAAGTDSTTLTILREAVVCIDPVVNPDGRERFLSQMQQWNGPIPNPDAQSLHHTGTWPGGRGNHYLFDLNRDWFILANAEMRERVGALVQWNPQVVIDSHEMGSSDTYLFSPPRQPLNPNISPVAHIWWPRFAADQAKAFDRYGWSYYTREWNDDWYPGYGASWPLYAGAVGILYEQAGVQGTLVKKPDGTVMTYREAVHHHFTSSMANFATAARNRKGILKDFAADRARGGVRGKNDPRTFYIVPGENAVRADRLVERLVRQGITVGRAAEEWSPSGLVAPSGTKPSRKKLPRGTYIVSVAQPLGRLVVALLEFDPRMNTQVLADERKSLEKDGDSKMYDITAWSLPLASGIESYWSASDPGVRSETVESFSRARGELRHPDAAYGYLMRCADDREVEALALCLQEGLKARVAREPFTIDGVFYDRGSILFRKQENPPVLASTLKTLAESLGVTIRGTATALSTAGPDLGGNDMVLLRQPRVALLGGPEVSSTNLGWIWHLLERQLGMRVSILALQQMGFADLSKYTTLILPSGRSEALSRSLGRNGLARLLTWIEAGGTLIAEEGSAAFVADSASGLSTVRLRQQVLKELPLYAAAAEMERKALAPGVDSAAFWGGNPGAVDTVRLEKGPPIEEKALALQDERGRLFAPVGAILNVVLDDEHWLAYGAGRSMPVLTGSSTVLMSRSPIQTPARYEHAAALRLSGLLWPEARERIARSAYLTREGKGRGQIILFSGEPAFRRGFPATERLLVNAVLLGPGCGTVPSTEW